MGPGEAAEAPYPEPQLIVRRHRKRFFQKVANLTFMVGIVAVVVVNLLYPQGGWWMWTALPVICYAWLTVSSTALSPRRLASRLTLQVYALSALLVVLDLRFGWLAWSTTYAVPAVFVIGLIAGAVMLLVALRGRHQSLPIGFIVTVAVGAIALPFLGFAGWLTVGWPALAAAILGLSLLLAMAVFFRKDLAEYMRSQWHF